MLVSQEKSLVMILGQQCVRIWILSRPIRHLNAFANQVKGTRNFEACIYLEKSLSSSNRTFWKPMSINGLRCIWPVFEWWNMLPESIRGNNLFLPGRGLDRIESYGMTHTVWLFDRWAVIRETILESGLETTVISLKKIHHCNQFLGCFLLLLLHCLRFSSLALFF